MLSRDDSQGELLAAFEELLSSIVNIPSGLSGNDEIGECHAEVFFDAEENPFPSDNSQPTLALP